MGRFDDLASNNAFKLIRFDRSEVRNTHASLNTSQTSNHLNYLSVQSALTLLDETMLRAWHDGKACVFMQLKICYLGNNYIVLTKRAKKM